MSGLFAKGAFEKALVKDLPGGANALKSKLILAAKNAGASKERKKARLAAMARKDQMKEHIVNDSPILMKRAMRLVLFITSCLGLQLCSRDVKQAYLQSESALLRDICITLPKGYSKLGEECVLKVIKPLCGIAESGDYWIDTYMTFFLAGMNMTPFVLGPCFMCKKEKENLTGMVGMIVDDTIAAGAKSFIQEEDEKRKKFRMSPKEVGEFDFSGVYIKQSKDLIALDQTHYASSAPKIL